MESLIIWHFLWLEFPFLLSCNRFWFGRPWPPRRAGSIRVILIVWIRGRFPESSLFVKDAASFGRFPSEPLVIDDSLIPRKHKKVWVGWPRNNSWSYANFCVTYQVTELLPRRVKRRTSSLAFPSEGCAIVIVAVAEAVPVFEGLWAEVLDRCWSDEASPTCGDGSVLFMVKLPFSLFNCRWKCYRNKQLLFLCQMAFCRFVNRESEREDLPHKKLVPRSEPERMRTLRSLNSVFHLLLTWPISVFWLGVFSSGTSKITSNPCVQGVSGW